jgi:ribosome biogenesis GTPase
LKEPGCAVREAMEQGRIHKSRHESYERLYEVSAKYREWEK